MNFRWFLREALGESDWWWWFLATNRLMLAAI
jgi:hypothetical protein